MNAFADSVYNQWNTTKTLGPNIVRGPHIGGNYWSDYVGNDTDGDGIGDAPHPIRSYSEVVDFDYFPLIDIVSPQYALTTFNSSAPDVMFSIIWKDSVHLDKVIFELDGMNATNPPKFSESFGSTSTIRLSIKPLIHYFSFCLLGHTVTGGSPTTPATTGTPHSCRASTSQAPRP